MVKANINAEFNCTLQYKIESKLGYCILNKMSSMIYSPCILVTDKYWNPQDQGLFFFFFFSKKASVGNTKCYCLIKKWISKKGYFIL